ncbi:MAG TPA: hypothetical protein VFS35_07680 [Terrimicrobiaceae bacterium]|nr:hypothetical protein [Terrimicrobiaceae bacterium]
MRGTPWIRFAVTAWILALAGIPIWLLTQTKAPTETAATPAAASQQTEQDFTLQIESAPAAESIGVSYLGRELISVTPTGGNYSGTVRLPTEGADLVVMARWSGTLTAALRVKVSNQDGPVAEASYWGIDRVEDVLAIPASRE